MTFLRFYYSQIVWAIDYWLYSYCQLGLFTSILAFMEFVFCHNQVRLLWTKLLGWLGMLLLWCLSVFGHGLLSWRCVLCLLMTKGYTFYTFDKLTLIRFLGRLAIDNFFVRKSWRMTQFLVWSPEVCAIIRFYKSILPLSPEVCGI